ncbi:SNARE domain containing protein [Trichomonas vaginalis G3]|uniref:SNARE domain containing protein n=1 Tax=Trichomonas vaginalis (strain ATCC PRA-98 / G3) TaxID=412133 RepID=A2DBH8_TRIV3|nr:SNARE fusion complex family [Trichomonas vaginalis G3]EAY22181.1 SNARE domain containing protein [Trichomonas vaginalis G3]KAI5533361.1 SNARE fusion complex family [Trichomonas vaginalis G3]|eukprot:XP_001583167.1 SNARE domain containing protein [Trichomonas vaginalis G3]
MDEEFQRLQMQREQQEANLNMIVQQTGEVKQITIMIGDELENQNKMLLDVDNKMDTVQDKIKKNIEAMEKLTQSSNGPLILICVILTLVLIGLLYWAL